MFIKRFILTCLIDYVHKKVYIIKCMYAVVGCKYAVVGCMYAETFGCMYAEVGCKFHNG